MFNKHWSYYSEEEGSGHLRLFIHKYMYQAPINNVPGIVPGARHTEIEASLSNKEHIVQRCSDTGLHKWGSGRNAGGSLGSWQRHQEGATVEGDKDAGNGLR